MKGIARIFGFIVSVCCASNNLLADIQEYKLKAAFIEKFTHFIEWPSDSKVNDKSIAFKICQFGNNPISKPLTKLTQIIQIKGKSVETVNIEHAEDVVECDLVIISKNQTHSVAKLRQYTYGQPILSIADSPGVAQKGVIINFFYRDGGLGFEINIDEAKASGFDISSRLLKLSRVISENSPTP